MHIMFDVVFDHKGLVQDVHYADLSLDMSNLMQHPEDASQKIHKRDFLVWLGKHPEALEKAGWLVKANPRIFGDRTRWQVLNDHMSHHDMPDHVRLLVGQMQGGSR